ncbi:MAG: hypothetical protein IT428_33625 [Planctomycetaceae bacterium]|nr:hypothetical protein [Planctomycetaceae bacterium]
MIIRDSTLPPWGYVVKSTGTVYAICSGAGGKRIYWVKYTKFGLTWDDRNGRLRRFSTAAGAARSLRKFLASIFPDDVREATFDEWHSMSA